MTFWRWCDAFNLSLCGPMLVTEPNVVWLLVTVLVVAIVFVTTTLASGRLLCWILPCPRCFERPTETGWRNSAGSSSDGQVIWVARLSSNSKNWENPLFNNNKKSFLLKHVCETINNKQTRFALVFNYFFNSTWKITIVSFAYHSILFRTHHLVISLNRINHKS